MANGKNDWRSGPEANQLRREFREEAIKLRNEMRDEFQRKMAEQMAQMQAQQHGAHQGNARQGGPRGRKATPAKATSKTRSAQAGPKGLW